MFKLFQHTAEEIGVDAEGLLVSFLNGVAKRTGVLNTQVEEVLELLDSLEGRHALYNHLRDGKIGLTATVEDILNKCHRDDYTNILDVIRAIGLEQRCLSLKHIEADPDLISATRIVDFLRALAPQQLILITTDPVRRKKFSNVTDIVIGMTNDDRSRTTVCIPGKIRMKQEYEFTGYITDDEQLMTGNPRQSLNIPHQLGNIPMVTNKEHYDADLELLRNKFGQAVEVAATHQPYQDRLPKAVLTFVHMDSRIVVVSQETIFIPYTNGQSILIHMPDELKEHYSESMIKYHEDPHKMYGTSSNEMPLTYNNLANEISTWLEESGLVGLRPSLKGMAGDFEGVIDESTTKITDIHGSKGIVVKVVEDGE